MKEELIKHSSAITWPNTALHSSPPLHSCLLHGFHGGTLPTINKMRNFQTLGAWLEGTARVITPPGFRVVGKSNLVAFTEAG